MINLQAIFYLMIILTYGLALGFSIKIERKEIEYK